MVYGEDIASLEDLLVPISEEYGRCWLVDGGELARDINQKKRPGILQACRCSLCDKCYWRVYVFNNQSGIL